MRKVQRALLLGSGDEHGFWLWAGHHRWNLLCHAVVSAGLSGQRAQGVSGKRRRKHSN